MLLELKLIELEIRRNKKSPLFLANLLTSVYYEDYYSGIKSEDSFEELLFDFYIQHYGGKSLNKEKGISIAEWSSDNLSILIFCIYFHEISDDSEMMALCLKNLPGVYTIILEGHNINCPDNAKEAFALDQKEAMFLLALSL